MTAGFPELVLGGVLVAPFVGYAVLAGLAVALLRPLLRALRARLVPGAGRPPAAALAPALASQ